MQKLAIAVVLVAMFAIGLAGVAGASGNCDGVKSGTCDEGACAHASKLKKGKKKGSQPQSQATSGSNQPTGK
jgi:hypothetical protein